MHQKNDTEKKKAYLILGAVFVALLFLFLLINIITKDRSISESENRMLAQRPGFSLYRLLDGSFEREAESYVSDQFAGRDLWRNLYTGFRVFGGNREENGVIRGRNGQLLQDIVVPEEDLPARDISAFASFSARYPDVSRYLLLVPDAAQITDARPLCADIADQAALFASLRQKLPDTITWIDGISAMQKHSDEKLYYKTDHHWTSQGAYAMFRETSAQLGLGDAAALPFRVYPVTTEFNGTLASSSGFCLGEQEEIDIYVPETDIPLVVTYEEEQERSASLYQSAPLKTKDKYAVFLGGNHPLITIETSAQSSRRLLLVKDSFANCFVPFLVPWFKEIVIADPRYYTGTADDLLSSGEFTDVLFLYSGNTFFSDNNIAGFLSGE